MEEPPKGHIKNVETLMGKKQQRLIRALSVAEETLERYKTDVFIAVHLRIEDGEIVIDNDLFEPAQTALDEMRELMR